MTAHNRMAPQYCPYCADQDLRPSEDAPAAWECRGCLRIFAVSFVAVSGVSR